MYSSAMREYIGRRQQVQKLSLGFHVSLWQRGQGLGGKGLAFMA